MQKIHMKQNINWQLTKQKVQAESIQIIQKFIEYSNDMDDVYKNIEEYNLNKKHKIAIALDDMIADMK